MDTSSPLVRSLRAERLSLIEEILSAAPPGLAWYTSPPLEAQAAARVVDLVLDALDGDRAEAVRAFGTEAFEQQPPEGAALADVSRVPQVLRRLIAARVWKSGAALEQAGAVVDRINDVLDELTDAATVRFERHLEETQTRRIERALKESELTWRTLIEAAPLPLLVQEAGNITWANDAMMQLLRASTPEQIIGRSTLAFTHPDDREAVVQRRARVQAAANEPLPRIEMRVVGCDGTVSHVEATSRIMIRSGAPAVQIALVDMSARKEAELARRQSEVQAQVIQAQTETLRILSTPLIPLDDGTIVMPLVGRITIERASGIVERLAAGVVEQRARVAIVDVTGVPDVDAGVAEVLGRAARVVRLLGAAVVLTGIQPSIARTLVEIGVDLGGIATRGTLRDGIHYALGSGAARSLGGR